MSPQATAAPEQTMAQRQIARAARLERERAALAKEVDANRKFLRLMADTDELSDKEEDFVDTFYPEKEKNVQRSKEEIEATRKLREAVRKEDWTFS